MTRVAGFKYSCPLFLAMSKDTSQTTILANVRREVPQKVALVGEKISHVLAGAVLKEAAAIRPK